MMTAAEYKELMAKSAPKKDTRSKKGFVTIGGIRFFARSTWEANIGAYLEWLKTNGEIARWDHEPDTFWFEGAKRGTVSYLPDFKVWRNDGSIYYIEVKGYMDKRSATKLKRMKKYHPDVELQLIDKKRYDAIKKNSNLYKGWGLL